ncbi:proprotein convertase P-domain-containing protein, partial [Lysobacter sp. 2RAB21]
DGATNTKTGSVTVGTSGSQTYTNGTDVAIIDNATVESSITVSGRTGNGSPSTPVQVTIYHTYKSDIKVDLVAPDGTLYNIHN